MNASNQELKANTSREELIVILVVGPGGAGKTSLGKRIGQEPTWHHIAEDAIWDQLPRDPFSPRTDAEKAAVQRRVVEATRDRVAQGENVVLARASVLSRTIQLTKRIRDKREGEGKGECHLSTNDLLSEWISFPSLFSPVSL
jgi:adenylate kinase family enzyme